MTDHPDDDYFSDNPIDNEIYGLPEERIMVQIRFLKESQRGRWEYAVWRGEEQLVLGFRMRLADVPAGVRDALAVHNISFDSVVFPLRED